MAAISSVRGERQNPCSQITRVVVPLLKATVNRVHQFGLKSFSNFSAPEASVVTQSVTKMGSNGAGWKIVWDGKEEYIIFRISEDNRTNFEFDDMDDPELDEFLEGQTVKTRFELLIEEELSCIKNYEFCCLSDE